jgi:hypothetical protein
MSENLRLGGIIAVFLILGLISWALFSGNGTEPELTPRRLQYTQTKDQARWQRYLDHYRSHDARRTNTTKYEGHSPQLTDESRYDRDLDTTFTEVTVSPNGRFEFKNLPMGYYLAFVDTGAYTGSRGRHLTLSRPHITADIQINLSTSLSGNVINTDGEPVPDAQIFVAGYLTRGNERVSDLGRSRATSVRSDESGIFEISSLQDRDPKLSYRLLAKAEGYAPTVTPMCLTGTSGVQIIMTEGANVSGVVMNTETNEPLKGVPVQASTRYAMVAYEDTTNSEGAFNFEQMAEETYTFLIIGKDFVTTGGTTQIEVRAEENTEGLIIQARKRGSITGHVYDNETVAGVSGAVIIALPQQMSGVKPQERKTNSTGTYTMTGLSAGIYKVYIRTISVYPEGQNYEGQQEVTTSLGTLTSNIDFGVSSGLSVTGTITLPNGDHVSNAQISGRMENNQVSDSARSDARGKFILHGFSPNATVQLSG